MKNSESKQNLIASLLAILIGLFIGFIVILIANPSQAFRAMGIMMSGGKVILQPRHYIFTE